MKNLPQFLLTFGFSCLLSAGPIKAATSSVSDKQNTSYASDNAAPENTGDRKNETTTESAGVGENNGARALAINTNGEAQSYPWLSDDALRVYYTHDVYMYMASRSNTNEPFGKGENILTGINLTIISGWLTPDELTLYFATQSSSLYVAHRSTRNENFTNYTAVSLVNAPGGSLFDASFTPDMNELFMYNNSNKEQIVRFEKTGDNEYAYREVVNFNTGSTPTGGQLSRDGLKFYVPLRVTEDVNDDNRKIYIASRTELHGVFTSIEEVKFTEPLQITAYQPSVSADGMHMVFVSGHDNMWDNNDLYEANLIPAPTPVSNTTVTDIPADKVLITKIDVITDVVINPEQTVPVVLLPADQREGANPNYETPEQKTAEPVVSPRLSVYPNPFSDQTTVEIMVPESGYLKVDIYNAAGQFMGSLYDGQTEGGLKILSWFRNASNSVLNNGVYTVKALVNKTIVTKKVVVCEGQMH